MPPTFRSSRSGRQFGEGANRTRTGQIDHDVFEGLPVRRWTRQIQTVSQEPKSEGTELLISGPGGKQNISEHPMPRDSHLLAPMSKALLRAARAGCIYIRQASKDSEDEEKEATDVEEQQLAQRAERSFVTRKWSTVPKHLETPEVEFLAKRRPGLPSLYGATTGITDNSNNASAPMRKTRFKKVDPVTGNISIYAAWVPEGHKIEGEVADDAQLIAENSQVTVTPEAPAPGTVIEGVGVVNAEGVVVAEAGSVSVITPPKRRPPPPKRKAKGFGKGRRKKVMFAPGDGADASLVHGTGAGAAPNGKDSDPARISTDQAGQEDDDEDGEEGEDSDDGDGDESILDAKTPETPGPQLSTEPELEPEPEPSSGPVVESTPAPTIASTEVKAEPQPPSKDISEATPQAPVPSVASPTPESSSQAAGQHQTPASPEKQPENTEASPVIQEDVQMTDVTPSAPIAPIEESMPASASPKLDSQQAAAPEVYKDPSQQTLSPPQNIPNRPSTESLEPPAENAEAKSIEPPEPVDTVMNDLNEPAPQPIQEGNINTEDLMDIAQHSPEAQAPEISPISIQEETQPIAGNDFDLLGSLEASLDTTADAPPSDKKEDTLPEQQIAAPTLQESTEENMPHSTPEQSSLEPPVEPTLAEAPIVPKENTSEEPAQLEVQSAEAVPTPISESTQPAEQVPEAPTEPPAPPTIEEEQQQQQPEPEPEATVIETKEAIPATQEPELKSEEPAAQSAPQESPVDTTVPPPSPPPPATEPPSTEPPTSDSPLTKQEDQIPPLAKSEPSPSPPSPPKLKEESQPAEEADALPSPHPPVQPTTAPEPEPEPKPVPETAPETAPEAAPETEEPSQSR